MTSADSLLDLMQRPRLLIKAAHIGAKRYKRRRHLSSLTADAHQFNQDALLKDLLEKENDLEWTRRSGASDYNVKRHILILSALISEASAQDPDEQAPPASADLTEVLRKGIGL
jgi:hypothetical protein